MNFISRILASYGFIHYRALHESIEREMKAFTLAQKWRNEFNRVAEESSEWQARYHSLSASHSRLALKLALKDLEAMEPKNRTGDNN